MRIGRAREIHQRRPFLKVAIVGGSGSGKTDWAARAPKPLIIATEPQQVASAVVANPDATIVIVETWGEFRVVWNALKLAKSITVDVAGEDGSTEKQPACEAVIVDDTVQYQTVVVDSFTDLQRLAFRKVAGLEDGIKDRFDFDAGAVNFGLDKWGMLISACESIFGQQRALACNTVFLFVAEEITDDVGRRMTIPMLSGVKLPYAVGQYFNAVGLQQVMPGANGGLSYRTRFALPSAQGIAKPAPGFPAYITHTREPGKTTLGSLGRHSYPDLVVAAEPHDSASFVTGPPAPIESASAPQGEAAPQSRRRRRTG